MLFRIISALIGIPIIFGAVVSGLHSLFIFCCIVTALGHLEIARLLTRVNINLAIAPSLFFSIAIVTNGFFGSQFLLEIISLSLIISGMLCLRKPLVSSSVVDSLATFAAPFVLGIPFSIVLLIRAMDGGVSWIIFILLVTFGTDSGAYFVGKIFGRRPMAKRISPSKTIEGAFGGLLASLILGVIWGSLSSLELPMWQAALFGVTLGVAGQIGDLIESAFKRAVEVKDSGSIIPGHGGVLDRVDSIALNIVVAYYLLMFLPLQ